MNALFETATRWVSVTRDEQPCPECDGHLEETYVHDPAFQDHWRGSPALACESCEYAERRED